MQILKKIYFYLFIALALSLAVWGYFKLKENKAPTITVFEHIDKKVSCLTISNNINELVNQLTRQNLIWNSLKSDTAFYNIHQSIHALDSVIKIDTELADLFKNNALYSCFFNTEKSTNYLLILKVKEISDQSIIKSFFSARTQAINITGADLGYEFPLNKKKYFIAYIKGLLLVSLSKQEIEHAIQLPLKESITIDEEFNDLLKANGTQNNLCYLNKYNQTIFKAEPLLSKAIYQSTIKPDNITLNGFAIMPQLSKLFSNQKASVIDVFNFLPQNPSSIIGISLSNAIEYNKQFEENCNQQELDILNASWKNISDTLLYNVKNEFLENIDKQMVSAYYSNATDFKRVSAIAINDTETMTELLKVISDSVFTEKEQPIYKLSKLHQSLFSLIQSSDKNEYALISENILILCNNQLALQFYKQQAENNLLNGKDSEMNNYADDNFSVPFHLLYYNNYALLSNNTHEPLIVNQKSLLIKNKALSKTAYTAKMLTTNWQVRLNAMYAKVTANDTLFDNNNLWEFETDSIISSTPFSFVNHHTQENEVCIQTANNELRLLNATGNLIWTKKINEPIQSQVFTVDMFKNGKLQLLFNTKNYIHLIDRNGNDVQGYPVKLPSAITSNITLLDYDKDKNYRLLLACADRRIYNYTIYGIKTDGFLNFKTTDIVHSPIQYVKVGLSDYLIAIDDEGKVYAFSRKGEGRIILNNHAVTQLTKYAVIAGNTIDNTKIIYIDDKNNLLNKISLSDKKETIKLGDEVLNFDTQFDFVNNDTQLDVICFGDGALYGYDLFSNKIVEYFSATAVYSNVQIAKTSTYTYIVAFDKAGNKIDVLHSNGKMAYSLPFVTKVPLIIDLYKNGTLYMMYSNNNKLMCKALK